MATKKVKIEEFKQDLVILRNRNGSYSISGAGWSKLSSEHGKSKGIIDCPCCGNVQEFFIWSIQGVGKYCDNCNVLLYTRGAYIGKEHLNKTSTKHIESIAVNKDKA